MSQKTKIIGVKHSGASVYLGTDKFGNPMWTRDPNRIMQYLCDGYRYRFNQFRALREGKRVKTVDAETGEEKWISIPLGGEDVEQPQSEKDIRNLSWMAAIPNRILSYSQANENTEWGASIKRISTLLKKGVKRSECGDTPGFKKKYEFNSFVIDGVEYRKVSSRVGIVTLKSQMRKEFSKCGVRWNIQIRVRTSEDIRKFTSVRVNLMNNTLIFTNAPTAITREPTGKVVGIDRGVTHTLATSDGEFLDIPKRDVYTNDKMVRLQREMSRKDRVNGAKKFASSRRNRVVAKINKINKKESNRRKHWINTTTYEFIKRYNYIATEELNTKAMTKKGKGKRGLNRAILQNSWAAFNQNLQYKAELAGVKFVQVDPAYTSQTCYACGHVSRDNRKSQSRFECVKCGHTSNADINAAKNILRKAAKV